MKFPNHIILDIKQNICQTSSQYWIFTYLLNVKKNPLRYNFHNFHKIFLINKKKLLNKKFFNLKKFTLSYNTNKKFNLLLNKNISTCLLFSKPRPKLKHENFNKITIFKQIYFYLSNKSIFNIQKLKKQLNNLNRFNGISAFKSAQLWNLFTINYLRKEKLYTKLKYSRTPQYDIVSGGVAAIFSGFLGFLICEKFGFELLDSGDFYFLFMYIVFVSFFFKLLIRLIDNNTQSWTILSYKWFYNFYKTLIILNFKRINRYFH